MKNKKIIAILATLAGVMAIGLVVYVIYSWYVENTLNTDSNDFYAVREGYEEHFESYDTINGNTLPSYANTSAVASYTMVPGDIVYFAYILDVRADEVSSSATTYTIEHTGVGAAKSSAITSGSSTNGNYNNFLANCCIEEDSIRVAIMDNAEDGVNYTYSSELTDATNTADTAFYDETNGIDITYDITIPATQTDVTYTDDDNVEHICLMIYVPIWYQDTSINQNEEMSSSLTIKKTLISL